jgi:YggT family protein
MSNQFIGFTVNFILILRDLITYAIIGRIIVSWVNMGRPGPRGPISQFLYDVTDPILNVAKKLPHRIGMIDLSPIIVIIGVELLARLIIRLLTGL